MVRTVRLVGVLRRIFLASLVFSLGCGSIGPSFDLVGPAGSSSDAATDGAVADTGQLDALADSTMGQDSGTTEDSGVPDATLDSGVVAAPDSSPADSALDTTPPDAPDAADASDASDTGADVGTVNMADAPAGPFTIGVTVTGLAGGSVVLQDNGSDSLTVTANGSFTFVTELPQGAAYAVTVQTQPAGPTQRCVVTNGSGTVGLSNVTGIAVACTTQSFTVGGTLTGLTAGSVELEDNGGDDLTVAADGSFTFATPVPSGGAYDVTIASADGGATCTVSAATGTVGAGPVTSVVVNGVAGSSTIGGTISGLAQGDTLILQDNAGPQLFVTTNGAFAFPASVTDGSTYAVTIAAQPVSPVSETCTITKGTGTASGNVTDVAVACVASSFAVGGTLAGLTSGAVVLQDNGGNNLSLTSNGAFAFTQPVTSGQPYAVTVLSSPTGTVCTVAGGSGTVGNAAVTSVQVSCSTGGCGRFATGATGSWTVGATTSPANNNGFSDITPVGGTGFYLNSGSGTLYGYTEASRVFTSLGTVPNESGYAGPAWIGGTLYFMSQGEVATYTIATGAFAVLATGLPGASGGNTTHDSSGNLYTVDSNGKVLKYTLSSGTWSEISSALGNNQPHIAFDACTNLLYVTPQFEGGSVYSVNPTTGAVATLPSPPGSTSDALCSDNSGHVFILNPLATNAYQLNTATSTWVTLPSSPALGAQNGSCTVADDGNLYAVGGGGQQVLWIALQ